MPRDKQSEELENLPLGYTRSEPVKGGTWTIPTNLRRIFTKL
jgi:hypothetical protein